MSDKVKIRKRETCLGQLTIQLSLLDPIVQVNESTEAEGFNYLSTGLTTYFVSLSLSLLTVSPEHVENS